MLWKMQGRRATLAAAAVTLIVIVTGGSAAYYVISSREASTSGQPSTPFSNPIFLQSEENKNITNWVGQYPVPGFGPFSSAEIFNCRAAAATSSGCTQVTVPVSATLSFEVTVRFPYPSGNPESSGDCSWYMGAYNQSFEVSCDPLNSTSFVLSEPAPLPA